MLSLVIPVYNAEKYLPRLMRGVLEQTCGDFEVILVDDGSTDGSLALCRSYASERVRVVSVPNGGPAMARNHGIDACSPRSRYVVFADSDDEIAPDYLTALMQEPEADLVVAGRVEVFHDYTTPYSEFPFPRSFTDVRTDSAFAATLERGILSAPWAKRFSLDIIRSHGLRFKDMRILEDIDFVFRYLTYCREVVFVPETPYRYIHRYDSETSTQPAGTIDRYMQLHKHMLDWFAPQCHTAVHRFVFHQYYGMILRLVRSRRYRDARHYLACRPVRMAFASRHSANKGERVLSTLLRLRLVRLARLLFLR